MNSVQYRESMVPGRRARLSRRVRRGGRAEAGRALVAQSTDILTLDATIDSSAVGINVFRNVFDQLTMIGANGSVQPMLATSWIASSEARVWTFTLRKNAKFHNGEPVTVDDVKWTFEKIMADQKSANRTYLTQIDGIDKLDDDHIRFRLKAPWAVFDRQVSLISIVPRKAYEEMGAQKFSTAAIGSGPFKVVRWIKDTAVELEAFPTTGAESRRCRSSRSSRCRATTRAPSASPPASSTSCRSCPRRWSKAWRRNPA